MVVLSKRKRNGKTGGVSLREETLKAGTNRVNCFEAIQRSCYHLPWVLSTYRQLAPGTTDGHNLFTMEGELLLKALQQTGEKEIPPDYNKIYNLSSCWETARLNQFSAVRYFGPVSKLLTIKLILLGYNNNRIHREGSSAKACAHSSISLSHSSSPPSPQSSETETF